MRIRIPIYTGMSDLGCVRTSKDGVLIDIRVIPNAKNIKKTAKSTKNTAPEKIFGYDEWDMRLRVRISAPAIKGKANKEVTCIFSGIFGNCNIVSGKLSRKKTVLVPNQGIRDVVGKLRWYLLAESE